MTVSKTSQSYNLHRFGDFNMERNLCFLSGPPLPVRERTRHRISPLRPRAQIDQATEKPSDKKQELDMESEEPAATTTVCEGCGREGGIAPGCDGTGRIQGGLGVVVKWWPIKAYRPCPDYLKAKKKYQRAGQSLDEIAFGRKGRGDDLSVEERLRGD